MSCIPSHWVFETGSHYIVQASYKFKILLSQPPKCGDYRCASPHPAESSTLKPRTQGHKVLNSKALGRPLIYLFHTHLSSEHLLPVCIGLRGRL
jgi:hypothetical protein